MYAYLDDDALDVLDECAGGVGGLHGRRAPDPSPPHILPSHASGSPRCCRRRWCGGPTPNNNRGGALCGVPGRENSAGGGALGFIKKGRVASPHPPPSRATHVARSAARRLAPWIVCGAQGPWRPATARGARPAEGIEASSHHV